MSSYRGDEVLPQIKMFVDTTDHGLLTHLTTHAEAFVWLFQLFREGLSHTAYKKAIEELNKAIKTLDEEDKSTEPIYEKLVNLRERLYKRGIEQGYHHVGWGG